MGFLWLRLKKGETSTVGLWTLQGLTDHDMQPVEPVSLAKRPVWQLLHCDDEPVEYFPVGRKSSTDSIIQKATGTIMQLQLVQTGAARTHRARKGRRQGYRQRRRTGRQGTASRLCSPRLHTAQSP